MSITQDTISVEFDSVANASYYKVSVSPDDFTQQITSTNVTIANRNAGTNYTITVQSAGVSQLIGLGQPKSFESQASAPLQVTTGI